MPIILLLANLFIGIIVDEAISDLLLNNLGQAKLSELKELFRVLKEGENYWLLFQCRAFTPLR
ncbi:MAG: hypothetical protein U1C19_11260 [Methanobacteriaceae archaeon]|nr:hypothetical protein [Methanobacteriaceae archaeon]